MKKITAEELKNDKRDGLTLKRLREFILNNEHLSDDTPVMIERVTDIHFKDDEPNNGWPVYTIGGFHYHSHLILNKSMKEEIELRKTALKEEWEYPRIKNPEDYIYNDEELESLKEQFYRGWCISKDENNIILIYSHY